MHEATQESPSRAARPMQRHAQCIEASKRIRWGIDREVIRRCRPAAPNGPQRPGAGPAFVPSIPPPVTATSHVAPDKAASDRLTGLIPSSKFSAALAASPLSKRAASADVPSLLKDSFASAASPTMNFGPRLASVINDGSAPGPKTISQDTGCSPSTWLRLADARSGSALGCPDGVWPWCASASSRCTPACGTTTMATKPKKKNERSQRQAHRLRSRVRRGSSPSQSPIEFDRRWQLGEFVPIRSVVRQWRCAEEAERNQAGRRHRISWREGAPG